MNHEPNCPLCGEGVLETRIYGRDMQHKGIALLVEGLQYSYCPSCEAEITAPAQMDHNALLIRTAYQQERARVKAEQHMLTGEQIRAIREKLAITQKQAAKIFGGGPTAFSKYETEDIVQNTSMDKLLRLANAMPSAFAWLANRAGEKELASESMKRAFDEITSIMRQSKTPLKSAFAPSKPNSPKRSLSVVVNNSANDHHYGNDLLIAGG